MSFLPALLSRTAFRTGGSFLFFVICSFDDSKVLIKVYLNKEYFEFEFEFELGDIIAKLEVNRGAGRVTV